MLLMVLILTTFLWMLCREPSSFRKLVWVFWTFISLSSIKSQFSLFQNNASLYVFGRDLLSFSLGRWGKMCGSLFGQLFWEYSSMRQKILLANKLYWPKLVTASLRREGREKESHQVRKREVTCRLAVNLCPRLKMDSEQGDCACAFLKSQKHLAWRKPPFS